MMQTDDALACIEKLDQIAAFFPNGMTFTLDHEPMNHPDIGKILHAASHTKHVTNYHHGMTIGLPGSFRSFRAIPITARFMILRIYPVREPFGKR